MVNNMEYNSWVNNF